MSILFTTVSRKHLRSRNHSLGEEFHFDFRVHGGESSLNGQTAYRLVPILFDRSTLSILHRVQISNLEKTKRKLDSCIRRSVTDAIHLHDRRNEWSEIRTQRCPSHDSSMIVNDSYAYTTFSLRQQARGNG